MALATGDVASSAGREHLLEKRADLVGTATLQNVRLEACSGHTLQFLDHGINLGECRFIASDNQRSARRLNLHGDFWALATSNRWRCQRATLRESTNTGGNLVEVAAINTPRAYTCLRRRFNAVKLCNDCLKLRFAFAWALNNYCVGSGISADEDVLLLLQMRKRTTARIKRHRGLWIKLVERRCYFYCTTNAQRNDYCLALAILLSAAIDALDKFANLREHLFVSSDDQCVSSGVRVNTNWLLAAQIGRALVVTRRQQLRHLACIGSTYLQQSQGRELARSHGVKLPDDFFDRCKLRGLAHNPQRIGLFNRFNRWRRERVRWIVHLCLGNQVTHRRCEFRCLCLAHCHHAPGTVRAVQRGDQRGNGFQLLFSAGDTQLTKRVDPFNLRLGILRAVLGSQNLLRHLLQCRCYLGRLRVLQFKHASGTLDHRRLLG